MYDFLDKIGLKSVLETVKTKISDVNDTANQMLKDFYGIAYGTTTEKSDGMNETKYTENSKVVFSRGNGQSKSLPLPNTYYRYGNADENQDGLLSAGDKIKINNLSNPNLLINPDFKINQRGISGEFSETGKYFVDRWKLVSGTVTVNSDGTLTLNGSICQPLEYAVGSDVAASASADTAVYDDTAKTFTITGNGDIISWAKLEIGNTATPFSPPDIATEMAKCLRYYEKKIFGTTSGLPAVMWSGDLKYCYTNIPFFKKRISSPTITAATLDTTTWRFISSTGTFKFSNYNVASVSDDNAGIEFEFRSAPTSVSFGWVDNFKVIVDAEIY